MESEESVESGVPDGESAPKPRDDGVTDEGNGGSEVCDDGGSPEAHLSPR